MASPRAELDDTSPFGARKSGWFERFVWSVCDWRGFSQSLRQRLRKRFARKIVGPFDVTHRDINFRIYPAENYCDRVLFGRDDLPERAEHEALLPILSQDMTFVDIGANVGSYSAFVGTQAPGTTTILALEPHPQTYRKLMFNLQANGLNTDHVLNCGAGPIRTEMELWSDGGSNIGHTSMLKAGTSNPKVSVTVPVVPLPEILREQNIHSIDLLKIDVEGFEDQALAPLFESGEKTLFPKHILIEVAHQHLWQVDLFKLFESLGYEEVFQTEENRLLSLEGTSNSTKKLR